MSHLGPFFEKGLQCYKGEGGNLLLRDRDHLNRTVSVLHPATWDFGTLSQEPSFTLGTSHVSIRGETPARELPLFSRRFLKKVGQLQILN